MKTNVAQTSLWAYDSLKDLTARQAQVYNIISAYGPISNFDIAERLGLPVNSVTGRTMELREKNLVTEAYKAPHPTTGRTVISWEDVQS